MDKIEHYNEAMRLLAAAQVAQNDFNEEQLTGMSTTVLDTHLRIIATTVATAQVHATLYAALHS